DGPLAPTIRNARSQTGMWTAAIVMRHSSSQNRAQMSLIHRNEKIQTFAADCPHKAFAKRVRLGRSDRSSENRQTHRREGPIDALCIHAVAIVDDVPMRLVSRNDHAELLRRPVGRRMRRDVPMDDSPRPHPPADEGGAR